MEENKNTSISDLLNSPELIGSIQSVINGLKATDSSETNSNLPILNNSALSALNAFQSLSQSQLINSISKLLGENQSERIALLAALRPFLSAEKQETLDLIIQILKALNIFTSTNILT